jgi:hypothetical protein
VNFFYFGSEKPANTHVLLIEFKIFMSWLNEKFGFLIEKLTLLSKRNYSKFLFGLLVPFFGEFIREELSEIIVIVCELR